VSELRKRSATREVWIETGKFYKVTLRLMTTSNYFEAGHRIRIEAGEQRPPAL